MKLNKYETKIVRASEKGELRPVANMKSEMLRMRKYARQDLKKDARINFRVSRVDFTGLRQRASRVGIPYQTLLSSLVHKYVSETLIDRTR